MLLCAIYLFSVDFSRVILSEYAGTTGSDYINANFIRGASGSPAYIASQGPLAHTVNDFWRMVVECEVHVIIMACNEDEAGKVSYKKIRCQFTMLLTFIVFFTFSAQM